ncbi:MAG: hypothetical protein LUE29_13450 [Lachnospiraceae bacterium]|nr:hypothetical protein [Lachnospiraceae bacterium]
MADFLSAGLQNIIGACLSLALIIAVIGLHRFVRNFCGKIMERLEKTDTNLQAS